MVGCWWGFGESPQLNIEEESDDDEST